MFNMIVGCNANMFKKIFMLLYQLIISHLGCGSIKDYTVFTDISKFTNWLKVTTGID